MPEMFKLWVYLSTTPLLWLTATLVAYVVADRISHWVGENQYNASYLAVKRRKMGHHPDNPVKLRAISSARKG